MKNKQTDIAVFFGGKPKATTTGNGNHKDHAAASSPSESKRKPDKPATENQDNNAFLKRLKKSGGNEAKTAPIVIAKNLEDPAVVEQTPPVSNQPLHSNNAETAAIAKAAAIEDEEFLNSDDSELEEDIEETKEPSSKANKSKEAASTSPKKSPLTKSTKLEGVGNLAIKAAAEHSSFDLSSLVTWKEGAPVPFSFLANTFEAIAEESKRLIITKYLINAFRAVIATSPQDLLPMVYLCTNQVAPAHSGLELGIGDATLIKALAQATGRKESAIKADYDSTGDLGMVAVASRATQKTMFAPPSLTIAIVFKAFKDIAASEGAKSQDRKRGLIVKLLVAAKQNEAGYVMRALQGKLRIGLAEQTVLTALAHAVLLQKESLNSKDSEVLASALEEGSQIVKQVYSECPSYDEMIPALLKESIKNLPSLVHFKPGVPVKPMLAKPKNGVSEVLDKFSNQPFTCEYKYDGERAQIHVLEDGAVKVCVVFG